jgi:hypothetical protein
MCESLVKNSRVILSMGNVDVLRCNRKSGLSQIISLLQLDSASQFSKKSFKGLLGNN